MSDLSLPLSPAPSIEALLDLAAGVDFLIRTRHQPQAASAADHLARGLLYHYRALQAARPGLPPDEADALSRNVVIAIVEAKMVSATARAGRAPHISRLRSLVEELLTVAAVEAGEAVDPEAAAAVVRAPDFSGPSA